MNIGDTLAALRRAYPRIGPARYLYAKPGDLRRAGKAIVVHALLVSSDGRASMHKTVFETRVRSVREWADWVEANLDDVLRGNVLAFVNRTFGAVWRVEQVIGWHFTQSKRSRE